MRKVNIELLKANLSKLHIQAKTYSERKTKLTEDLEFTSGRLAEKLAEINELEQRIAAQVELQTATVVPGVGVVGQ